MNKFDAIIIGSGAGGLICGNILSKEGMSVGILEKNRITGGALQTFSRKGVVFDTGVHYIGGVDKDQALYRYFHYLGIAEKLNLRRLNKDKFDVIVLEDKEYPLAQGFEHFIDQLLPFFPGYEKSLQTYISTLREIASSFPLYNLEVPFNHSEEHYRGQSAFTFFSSLNQSFDQSRKTETESLLSEVLAGNNFLYDGQKEKTPLYIPALINHSFITSAWRPINGSSRIADLLIEKLKSSGGELHIGTEVININKQREDFIIKTQSGEIFTSKWLVSGIHPANTLSFMDSSAFRKPYLSRIMNLENTGGAFSVYIILKPGTFPYLDYNIYYHSGKEAWKKPRDSSWPANYMLLTPETDETGNFAKNMVIMSAMNMTSLEPWKNSKTGQRDRDYYEFKNQKALQLLELAEIKFPGLQGKIDYLETSTPLTWRDYTGTPGGSMYGIQKDYHHPVESRILARTRIPKFLFTGQNINLHGVMGVMAGAVMTCSEILGSEYLINKIQNG